MAPKVGPWFVPFYVMPRWLKEKPYHRRDDSFNRTLPHGTEAFGP
jgi:hypothetical protein